MIKIENKLKECCLTCEHFDTSGIKGLSWNGFSCCGEPERVIACGHMEVCWKYNTKNLEKAMAKKPFNLNKYGTQICNAECPACHYSFPDIGGVNESYGEVEQYDYCPECGQRIDWTDLNKE